MRKKISKSSPIISPELIEQKILLIRGQKIILDKDLAELYGVETKQITRQVRRNIERFPSDFVMILTKEDFSNLKCHFGTSSWGGTRKPPYAFTEHGILMLSSVLNSERAIRVNIEIMRTFTKLRALMSSHEQLRDKIESIEKKYDQKFKIVFDAIKKLIEQPADKKPSIGFHPFKKEVR